MNLFESIKNVFKNKKPIILKQAPQQENMSSTAFIDKTSMIESDWQQQGTLNVPSFDVEEISYVLECESRRYSSELLL